MLILIGVLVGAVLVGGSLWWAVASERSGGGLPAQLDQSDFSPGISYGNGGECSGHGGGGDCGGHGGP